MLCRDGKVRKCILVLSTWLADHMENVYIHAIKTNQCPVCIATMEQVWILSRKTTQWTITRLMRGYSWQRIWKGM